MNIFDRIVFMTFTMLSDRSERDDKGAAMVEYALLVAGIAVVVFAAAFALGGRVSAMFDGLTF
jgi:pilus assembly protein Flp/PilA